MNGSNDQGDKQEEVYRLSSDLQAAAISVQTGDDLAELLDVVVRLSGLVNGRVDEMRSAFEASDWNRRTQDHAEMRPDDEMTAISAIYQAAEKIEGRLKESFKKSQLLAAELEGLEQALRAYLPVYRLGRQMFQLQASAEQVIRDACDDVGFLLKESFEMQEG